MALKGNWVDKVDGVDDVLAETTNEMANAIIELEEAVDGCVSVDELRIYVGEAKESANAYTDEKVGDIEAALDGIIAIQEELMGGEGA